VQKSLIDINPNIPSLHFCIFTNPNSCYIRHMYFIQIYKYIYMPFILLLVEMLYIKHALIMNSTHRLWCINFTLLKHETTITKKIQCVQNVKNIEKKIRKYVRKCLHKISWYHIIKKLESQNKTNKIKIGHTSNWCWTYFK